MTNQNEYPQTILTIFKYLCQTHPDLISIAIQESRQKISEKIWNYHQESIAYGPFKGLKLASNAHWGGADKGSMCLGLYENEVLTDLISFAKKYETFIDLGAADGYYGIGVLVGNLFKKSYCFELTELGRSVILENAKINNVSNQIVIEGKAEKDFYKKINPIDLENSILFVDIEGAEFDIFDAEIFEIFKKSVIYIELHDWFYEDGHQKLLRLKDSCNKTHLIHEITMGSRDLSLFKELSSLSDTDRWLICSEGRSQLMKWLRLTPLELNMR